MKLNQNNTPSNTYLHQNTLVRTKTLVSLRHSLGLLLAITHFYQVLGADTKVTNTLKAPGTGTSGSSETTSIMVAGTERMLCQPNTLSCEENFSCIRFDNSKEDEYTCIPTEQAFCSNVDYCQEHLTPAYKYCYLPSWDETGDTESRRQCFTVHSRGGTCLYDIHCTENLACIDGVCSIKASGNSTSTYNFDDNTGNYDDGTIWGISKYIVYPCFAIPVIIVIFCVWCWFVGSHSNRKVEKVKLNKYEDELKRVTIAQNFPGLEKEKKQQKRKTMTSIATDTGSNDSSAVIGNNKNRDVKLVVEEEKVKEEEKENKSKGIKSFFGRGKKEKKEEEVEKKKEETGTKNNGSVVSATDSEQSGMDIVSAAHRPGSSAVGSTSSRNSISSNTSGANRKRVVKKKTPSSLADTAETNSNKRKSPLGKKVVNATDDEEKTPNSPTKNKVVRVVKKKNPAHSSETGAKGKVVKKNLAGGNANASDHSGSSKPSSQRALIHNGQASKTTAAGKKANGKSNTGSVSNASMSAAISGQSASYFSGMSPVQAPGMENPATALYYQQMYNYAAQAQAQQYYANYMQGYYNPAAAAAATTPVNPYTSPNQAQAYYNAATSPIPTPPEPYLYGRGSNTGSTYSGQGYM